MDSLVKIIKAGLLLLFLAMPLWSGGESEAGGSRGRGKYLVDQGRIIPGSDIMIDSYIAQVDYHYPAPTEEIGVSFFPGQQIVSKKGQELVVHLGIQGRKGDFSGVAPLNLCFVLDMSGSMADPDKIDWLKQGMAKVLGKIRYHDTVSIVAAGRDVEIILAPVKMGDIREPGTLINRIGELRPYGKTNLAAGLKQGYIFLEQEYNPTHVNRLILLSDGIDENEDLLILPEKYKARGINITTIGFGVSFNLDLMRTLAKTGGGSSRFIGDSEILDKVFDTEFDRMIVPVARDLFITVTFLEKVTDLQTWGYNHRIKENKIEYFLPSLHFRDYETTFIRLRLPDTVKTGPKNLARLELEYTDMAGKKIQLKPIIIEVNYQSRVHNTGISHPTVLQAGTMLKVALALKDIGSLYYSYQSQYRDVALYRESDFSMNYTEPDTPAEEMVGKEHNEVNGHYQFCIKRAMDLTLLALKEIEVARLCLDEQLFNDEEYILQKYIDILGGSAGYYGIQLEELKNRKEIRKDYSSSAVSGNGRQSPDTGVILQSMISELLAWCEKGKNIAFTGFQTKDFHVSSYVKQIDDLASGLIKKQNRIKVFDPRVITSTGEIPDKELALVMGRDQGISFLMKGFVRMQEHTALVILRLYNCITGELTAVTQATIPVK